MTGHRLNRRKLSIIAGLAIGVAALVIWWQYRTDLALAQARVAQGSTLVETPCGPIEYAVAGTGMPLPAIHGSGGGYDQGMDFSAPLAARGIRAIALILLVPLAYKPPVAAAAMAPWVENLMMTAIGSDFLFWSGLQVAHGHLIGTVLATPPELLVTASPAEKARINAMMESILPVSARAAGLRHDTAAGKSMTPARLDLVRAPTLVISARYGTYASAEYTAGQIVGADFLGFETGGHTWVGHYDEVMAAIASLILKSTGRASR